MMIQALGITASVLAIITFLWKATTFVHRHASAPKGYATVLAAISLMSFLTLAAVLVLFWRG